MNRQSKVESKAISSQANAVLNGQEGEPKQTFVVLGVLLEFLASPEQVDGEIGLIRGTFPPQTVVPLHSHSDPEVFYVLEGQLEVYQATSWRAAEAGGTVAIPGNVRHALRNASSQRATTLTVTKAELYKFFRELARRLDPAQPFAPLTPEEMQRVFHAAAKHHYWIASAAENAAIGLFLGPPEEGGTK
jgi:quercetin dioxygenase-like cupin family protein